MTVAIARLSQTGWSSLEKDLKTLVSEIILGNLPREFILQSTINICSHLAKGTQPNFEFQNHGDKIILLERPATTNTTNNLHDTSVKSFLDNKLDSTSSGVSETSKTLISSPVADEILGENSDNLGNLGETENATPTSFKIETNWEANSSTNSLLIKEDTPTNSPDMESSTPVSPAKSKNSSNQTQQLLANLASFQQNMNKNLLQSENNDMNDQNTDDISQFQQFQNQLVNSLQNSVQNSQPQHSQLQTNLQNTLQNSQLKQILENCVAQNKNNSEANATRTTLKVETDYNNSNGIKNENVESAIHSLLEKLQNRDEDRNDENNTCIKSDANEDKPDGAAGGNGLQSFLGQNLSFGSNGLSFQNTSGDYPSLQNFDFLMNEMNGSDTSPTAGGKIRIKRFKCRFCTHTSNRKNELEDHERKHQTKMCFQCHLCDYKAKQIVTMKGHYYKVHGAKFNSKSLIHLNCITGEIVSDPREASRVINSMADELAEKEKIENRKVANDA